MRLYKPKNRTAEFLGSRTTVGIARWIKSQLRPDTVLVSDSEELRRERAWHNEHRPFVLGQLGPDPEAKLRPLLHSSAVLGKDVPVWDAQTTFGDTNLLISSNEMGEDFAEVLDSGTCALMRGHGSTVVGRSVREAVYTAVYLEVNAKLQISASSLGEIKHLTDGEIDLIQSRLADAKPGEGYDRAWQFWCRRAGMAHTAAGSAT